MSFSGYEVLTEIQNILGEDENKPRQEGMLVDASNRFFTLIPTVHPVVISDSEILKSKVLISNLSFYLNIKVICEVCFEFLASCLKGEIFRCIKSPKFY